MGFFSLQAPHQPMSRRPVTATSHPLCHRSFLGIVLVVLPTPLLADVPAAVQGVRAANCYCQCHESQTRRGCTKLCDASRRATRWLTTSCIKPRFPAPL